MTYYLSSVPAAGRADSGRRTAAAAGRYRQSHLSEKSGTNSRRSVDGRRLPHLLTVTNGDFKRYVSSSTKEAYPASQDCEYKAAIV